MIVNLFVIVLSISPCMTAFVATRYPDTLVHVEPKPSFLPHLHLAVSVVALVLHHQKQRHTVASRPQYTKAISAHLPCTAGNRHGCWPFAANEAELGVVAS